MKRVNKRALINQGRKSGLRTVDLYQALTPQAEHPPTGNGDTDVNGFTTVVGEDGKVTYVPKSETKGQQ